MTSPRRLAAALLLATASAAGLAGTASAAPTSGLPIGTPDALGAPGGLLDSAAQTTGGNHMTGGVETSHASPLAEQNGVSGLAVSPASLGSSVTNRL